MPVVHCALCEIKSLSYALVAGPYSLVLYAVDIVLMAHHRPDVFPIFETECMHLLIAASSIEHRTACLFIVRNDHRVNVWLFERISKTNHQKKLLELKKYVIVSLD